MATFSLTAVNVGSHVLGESDRIVVMFSREKGLHRAVAKGARKPGTKMAGKSEPLNINRLLLSKGKSLDIITQCESVQTFFNLRQDLERLSYALYFAELTQTFGQGLSEESETYFDKLSMAIGLMSEGTKDPAVQCLEFELALLDLIGLSPELSFCVACRQPVTDNNLTAFNYEHGGLVCQDCFQKKRLQNMAERGGAAEQAGFVRESDEGQNASLYLTPLVWKQLILARAAAQEGPDLGGAGEDEGLTRVVSDNVTRSILAARRLMQGYIEYKSGRRMKSLEVLSSLKFHKSSGDTA